MTCANVRRNLPLLAGGDLPARKGRKLLAHIAACPLCRKELDEYRSALDRIKAAARKEGAADWSEAEWKAVMVRVTGASGGKARPSWAARPRWALASGIAAVAVLAVTALLLKDSIFGPGKGAAAQTAAVAERPEQKAVPEKPKIKPPAKQETKKAPLIQPEYSAKGGGKASPSLEAEVKPAAGQDVLSVTLVSQETGLQVVWFFNKNFEWKGDEK
jgi:hypothetical protein